MSFEPSVVSVTDASALPLLLGLCNTDTPRSHECVSVVMEDVVLDASNPSTVVPGAHPAL